MAIPESIRRFVETHGIGFTPIHHRVAFTAQEEAAATHVPGREWAKTVVCLADGKPVLAVLPANDRVDLAALRAATGAREVRLAAEHEFSRLYPECETGAMAPFGPLYGQRVFVDEELARDRVITFHAGTHVDAMRMTYSDFVELVHPVAVRIGRHSILH
ncbi:MAG TPA: YbaK/EbsC family protein [Vicinamibacterales bacterium]|jgi:Ala-tRNA(Pro) deacylase